MESIDELTVKLKGVYWFRWFTSQGFWLIILMRS